MTEAAQEFITPLSARRIAGERAHHRPVRRRATEFDIGHIRLARDTDLVVVAPATADLMAKMAGGHADDLATDGAARDRQAGADRARDESADVDARGDAAQSSRGSRRTA